MTYDFATSKAHHDAQKEGLTLLIADIKDINEMVNGYLRFRFFLVTRTRELTSLVGKANEIVDQIQQKYLDE